MWGQGRNTPSQLASAPSKRLVLPCEHVFQIVWFPSDACFHFSRYVVVRQVKDKTGWKASFEPSSEPGKSLVASMFPPDAREDQCAFPLERCMRFLPHHHDTGGFFVAVLEKVDNLPLEMHPRRGVLRQQKKEAAGELADPTDVTPLSEVSFVRGMAYQAVVDGGLTNVRGWTNTLARVTGNADDEYV